MAAQDLYTTIPDIHDGLNRKERIILFCLQNAQEEFQGRGIPIITLYGRVIEHVDIDREEFQEILNRMVGFTRNSNGSMSYG